MNNHLAIYAGSFNPFHVGHKNIANQAKLIFGKDHVLVARGLNLAKVVKGVQGNIVSLYDISKDDLDLQAQVFSVQIGIRAEFYLNFLHEFIEEKERQGNDVTLIRGLRNGADLAYESNMIKFIRSFKPNLKVMFLICYPEFEHISSTALRELESFRPGSANKFIISQ